MVNKEEKFIYCLKTGEGQPQVFFNEILKSALTYKYKNSSESTPRVSQEDLTNAIFGVSDQDNLTLFGKTVNGQRVNELFITSIYLKYLDSISPDKMMIIAIPLREESYDVVVYITEKNGITDMGGGKCKLTKNFTSYHIQIKEEFDFKASQDGLSTLKEGIDISSLESKAEPYDELVLIFMRDYAIYSSVDAQDFLEKNKNVGLILMPSLEPNEIQLTDGADKGKTIKLEEGRFNFLLNTQGHILHIKYNVPNILQTNP